MYRSENEMTLTPRSTNPRSPSSVLLRQPLQDTPSSHTSMETEDILVAGTPVGQVVNGFAYLIMPPPPPERTLGSDCFLSPQPSRSKRGIKQPAGGPLTPGTASGLMIPSPSQPYTPKNLHRRHASLNDICFAETPMAATTTTAAPCTPVTAAPKQKLSSAKKVSSTPQSSSSNSGVIGTYDVICSRTTKRKGKMQQPPNSYYDSLIDEHVNLLIQEHEENATFPVDPTRLSYAKKIVSDIRSHSGRFIHKYHDIGDASAVRKTKVLLKARLEARLQQQKQQQQEPSTVNNDNNNNKTTSSTTTQPDSPGMEVIAQALQNEDSPTFADLSGSNSSLGGGGGRGGGEFLEDMFQELVLPPSTPAAAAPLVPAVTPASPWTGCLLAKSIQAPPLYHPSEDEEEDMTM